MRRLHATVRRHKLRVESIRKYFHLEDLRRDLGLSPVKSRAYLIIQNPLIVRRFTLQRSIVGASWLRGFNEWFIHVSEQARAEICPFR